MNHSFANDSREKPDFLRFNPIRHFIGRDQELHHVAELLKGEQTSIVISGPIGVGKTTFAAEFAARYSQNFSGGVFYLTFALPFTLKAQIAAYDAELELFEEGLSIIGRYKRVYAEFAKPIQRLFIIDNCDDHNITEYNQLLQEYLPQNKALRVILLTKNKEVSQTDRFQHLVLNRFTRSESIALLQHYNAHLSAEQAHQIAQELYDLPLSLTIAGRLLAQYLSSAQTLATKYVQALHHAKTKYSGLPDEDTGFYAVLDVSMQSLQHLSQKNPLLMPILIHASYFAANLTIPKDLLLHTLPNQAEISQHNYQQALDQLAELGLLEQNTWQVRLHLAIAYYCKTILGNQALQQTIEQSALDYVNNKLESAETDRLLAILKQLYFFHQVTDQANVLHLAALETTIGECEILWGNYAQAESMLEAALVYSVQSFGVKHIDTIEPMLRLAELKQARGNFEAAEPLFINIVIASENGFGPTDPRTATALHRLAHFYQDNELFQPAEKYLLRALDICQQIYGPNHPETASSLFGLAELYYASENYQQAGRFYQQALRSTELAYGNDHPQVAPILRGLMQVYIALSQFEPIEALCKREIALYQQHFAGMHPQIIGPHSLLGQIYEQQELYEQAIQHYQQALTINDQLANPMDPALISMLTNLAKLYQAREQLDKAEPLFVRVLAIAQESEGPNALTTGAAMNNLAYVYHMQGELNKAEHLFTRALNIHEQELGSHPDVAALLHNVAFIYYDQERTAEAKQYLLRAIAMAEKTLGKRHETTQLFRQNLAQLR